MIAFGLKQPLGEKVVSISGPEFCLAMCNSAAFLGPTQARTHRFGHRCSSDGIFQALLGPLIQQLFFLLWFLAQCEWWHLPQLCNGCEPRGSTKLLFTVFPMESCEVSDRGWGPVLIIASQDIIKGPCHNDSPHPSNFPVGFRGRRFPPEEPGNVAGGGWGLTLSQDQVSTACCVQQEELKQRCWCPVPGGRCYSATPINDF